MKFTKRDLASRKKIFQSLNVNGEVIAVSPAWLEKFGYESSEIIGNFFGSFLDENSLPQVKKNFPHLKDYGFVNNCPLIVKMKDGTRVEAVLNGISEYDETGKFQNTICEIRTIHDLLGSEQEIKKMLEHEKFLRNFLNLKSNILELMHDAAYLKKFLNKLPAILSEPLEIKAVYVKEKEALYTDSADHLNKDEIKVFEALCSWHNSKEFFFNYKDDAGITEEAANTLDAFNAFGFAGQVINLKTIPFCIVFVLNELVLKEEWTNALREVVSLIDYAIKSIVIKIEKDELTQELKQLSTTDPLTGIFNRRQLIKVLANEEKVIERYGGYFSLIMFDIDHFKMINDTYGHPYGDYVLREISQVILKHELRASDLLFRYGGEEFMVMLPHTDLNSAVIAAEKLNKAVAEHDFGKQKQITASFGVAVYSQGDNINNTIDRLDQCLYNAKAAGRNCVKS